MVLAMAYVLSQPFEKLYAPADALKRGTLFMKLDLPYGGRAW
ncbi:MAG: spore coat associated protein CotJA [Clostridia bacterium]|nr:spore coat associated protein CotJA [Clostridia bacterium]MBR6602868.1 spore coat associated protein CotJA [Clostridia bacterium]